MPSSRVPWSADEISVLTAIFFSADFSIGDDERIECKLIADAFGRTPASIDRQWRNIGSIKNGETHLKIGKPVKKSVSDFMEDPAGAKLVAFKAIERNGWPLKSLIKDGTLIGHLSAPSDSATLTILRNKIVEQAHKIDYKIFSSGSHGYQIETEITLNSKRKFIFSISITLIGSHLHKGIVDMKASKNELSGILEKELRCLPISQLPSGRLGASIVKRNQVGDEHFSISIRLNEYKEEK